MILSTTTDKLQVVTSSTADIHVLVDFADLDDALKEVTVDASDAAITSAVTTDILAAPASGFSRKAKWISIVNNHASASNTVTLQKNRNGAIRVIDKLTLAAGERMSYQEGRGVRVFDSEGREKSPNSIRPDGTASAATIAAHSVDTYYLGMQAAGRLAVGTVFRWAFRASKAAAGVATPIYSIRVGTAGTTADTARVTLTGVAQTAAADNGYFVVEAVFRAIGAAAVITAQQSLQHSLAATGFANVGSPTLAGTSASFDASGTNVIVGLSVNPGAVGAWVTDLVTLDTASLLP